MFVSVRGLTQEKYHAFLDDQRRICSKREIHLFRSFCISFKSHYGSELLNLGTWKIGIRDIERSFFRNPLPSFIYEVEWITLKWINSASAWKFQYIIEEVAKCCNSFVWIKSLLLLSISWATRHKLKFNGMENSHLFTSIINARKT